MQYTKKLKFELCRWLIPNHEMNHGWGSQTKCKKMYISICIYCVEIQTIRQLRASFQLANKHQSEVSRGFDALETIYIYESGLTKNLCLFLPDEIESPRERDRGKCLHTNKPQVLLGFVQIAISLLFWIRLRLWSLTGKLFRTARWKLRTRYMLCCSSEVLFH